MPDPTPEAKQPQPSTATDRRHGYRQCVVIVDPGQLALELGEQFEDDDLQLEL